MAGADTPHDAEEVEEAAAVVGSMLFASVSAHEGRRPARPADDLESLCYVLAHLASGALPWLLVEPCGGLGSRGAFPWALP